MGRLNNMISALLGKAVTQPGPNGIITNPEQQMPPTHIPSIPLMSIPQQEQLVSTMYTSMGVLGYIPKYLYRDVANSYSSWVYTAVDKIAKTIAGAPKQIYTYVTEGSRKFLTGTEIAGVESKLAGCRNKGMQKLFLKSSNIERREIFNHPVIDLLKHPNPIDTQSVFWTEIVQRMELAGSVGIYEKRNGLKTASELWVLPTSENGVLKPIPDPKLVISAFFYSDGNIQERFLREDIIWIHYPNPRNKYEGISALLAQIYPYNIDKYLMQHQYNFFQNNSFLGGTLETDKELTGTQVEELQEQLQRGYEGVKRSGKMMIAHSGFKVGKSMTSAAKDVLGGETDTVIRDKILSSYGINEGMVGLTASQNKANLDTARENYLSECIKPRWLMLKESLEKDLLAEFDDRLCIDLELPEFGERTIDITERQANLSQFVTTINEERQKMGLNSVAYGDGMFVPFNLTWTKDPTKPTAPAAPPASASGARPASTPPEAGEPPPDDSIDGGVQDEDSPDPNATPAINSGKNFKGGSGSGNHGHEGRAGERGGSGEGGGHEQLSAALKTAGVKTNIKEGDVSDKTAVLLAEHAGLQYVKKLELVSPNDMPPGAKGAMATFNPETDTMSLNEKYWGAGNEKAMQRELDKTVRAGYNAPGSDSPKAVLDHEFTHAKIADAAEKGGRAFHDLKDYAERQVQENSSKVEKGLSIYATYDVNEFVAEGYTEYKNSDSPRAYAMKIGKMVDAL